MAYKRQIDRLPIIPADAKEHNVVCHYCIVGCGYKAYTWDIDRQGTTDPAGNKFGVDLSKQQGAETEAWYAPVDVQRRQAGREGRPHRHQARQELRRELGPRLDPRRPHGRDVLLARAQHRAAAPDRPDGLALRPDAADELGGRPRPRRARHRGGDRRAGRGRALRLRLRPWRRGRRLREHLGHRQALLRRHEGEEHPHPQPAGLQLRGPCHPRHGRGRAQQLLRGRGTRRHHRRGRRELARDADQLLPEPLGPEPARDVHGQEEGAVAERAARARAASSSSIRGGR